MIKDFFRWPPGLRASGKRRRNAILKYRADDLALIRSCLGAEQAAKYDIGRRKTMEWALHDVGLAIADLLDPPKR